MRVFRETLSCMFLFW